MKIIALLAMLMCCASTSLAATPSQNGIEKLPPQSTRRVVGEWGISDGCTGGIIAAQGKHYWVQECVVNTGCCNGSHGIVLLARSAFVFTDPRRQVTYSIQTNGTLSVAERGKPEQMLSPNLDLLQPLLRAPSHAQPHA